MRETRQSGSEGGGTGSAGPPYPYHREIKEIGEGFFFLFTFHFLLFTFHFFNSIGLWGGLLQGMPAPSSCARRENGRKMRAMRRPVREGARRGRPVSVGRGK
jgi:hypothetical protein